MCGRLLLEMDKLLEALEKKHDREKEDLKKETVAMLKASKKNNRPQIEAKVRLRGWNG
jgi:hypothetical protein